MAFPGYRLQKIRFGVFDLDIADRALRERGKTVRLQPQQFDILLILVEYAGRVVSREEIRERIWDADTFVDFERNINLAINQIRAALKDNSENPRFIETVPKRGYRFIATIETDERMASGQPGGPVPIDRKSIASVQLQPEPVPPKFEAPAALIQPVADGGPSHPASADPAVASGLLEQEAAGPPSETSAATGTAVSPGAKVSPRTASNPLAWILVAILTVALGGLALAHFREPAPRHQRIRFQINQPDGQLGPFQLSPDGRFLAVTTLEETIKLWVRPLEAVDTRLVTAVPFDTDGFAMFWSWDGNDLICHSAGKLYKAALDGSPPAVLRDSIPSVYSGVWIDRDVILLGTKNGVFRLNPSGGPAVKLDDQLTWSLSPLPGNRYLCARKDGVFAGPLDGEKPVRILDESSTTTYIPASSSGSDGYLLFVRRKTLVAQSFDVNKLQLHGEAIPVEQHVGKVSGASAFTAAANGTLVFGHGDAEEDALIWVDRTGRKLQRVSEPFNLSPNPAIRLSPDDSKAIVQIESDHKYDLWIADLHRDTLTRFTREGSNSGIWSPDGRRVLWAADDGKRYLRAADDSGKDEIVYEDPKRSGGFPTDLSSDGTLIAFGEFGERNVGEIWLAPTTGDRHPYPYVQGSGYSVWGQFSPDGRWMAYVAEQFPHAQIFVESVPSGRGRRQISTGGGDWPIWRRDGKELFYRQGTQIMAVPIKLTETSVGSGLPQALFDVPTNTRFQVSRDGRRFLMALPVDNSVGLTIDTDWRAGLQTKPMR